MLSYKCSLYKLIVKLDTLYYEEMAQFGFKCIVIISAHLCALLSLFFVQVFSFFKYFVVSW